MVKVAKRFVPTSELYKLLEVKTKKSYEMSETSIIAEFWAQCGVFLRNEPTSAVTAHARRAGQFHAISCVAGSD